MGLSLDRAEREGTHKKSDLEIVATGLIMMQFVLYASSISGKSGSEIPLWPMATSLLVAVAFAWGSGWMEDAFSNVQRMVYLTGVGDL